MVNAVILRELINQKCIRPAADLSDGRHVFSWWNVFRSPEGLLLADPQNFLRKIFSRDRPLE